MKDEKRNSENKTTEENKELKDLHPEIENEIQDNKELKSEQEVKDEEQTKNEKDLSEGVNEQPDEKTLKIEALEKEVTELKDRFLRKAAEFENYKRRTENDQINLIKYAASSFILKLLPVMDDFERSLEHIEDAKDINSIKEGLKLIYDKLLKTFDEEGIKKIEAVGKPFDVNYHEAIMQREDASVEPLTILDEVETGYVYKDRVIRHSKVIVSQQPSEEPIENSNTNSQNDKRE